MIYTFTWPDLSDDYQSLITALNTANTVFVQSNRFDKTPPEIIVYTGEDMPLPPVPDNVDPVKLRIAMRREGVREQFETAVALSSTEIQDWWEFETRPKRMDERFNGLLSEEILDRVFRLAGGL